MRRHLQQLLLDGHLDLQGAARQVGQLGGVLGQPVAELVGHAQALEVGDQQLAQLRRGRAVLGCGRVGDLLHGRPQVGTVVQPRDDPEASGAPGDDVEAPVGAFGHGRDLRHRADVVDRGPQVTVLVIAALADGIGAPIGPHLATGPDGDDPEAAVTVQAVAQQLPVAGLEEVQRQRTSREQHQVQREEREVHGCQG